MATTNKKTTKSHIYADVKLAGGCGPRAAKQNDEATLRRLVMSCLLWENNAYCDGESVVEQIKRLVPSVDNVGEIAKEARLQQKLRHVPLLLAREMARNGMNDVSNTLSTICKRPDEITEFLSLYWKDNGGKKTLSSQVKKGLSKAFESFDEYQLAKYNRLDKDIKLRDALFLCHAKPSTPERESLYKRLINNELATPETWEVGLSAAKSQHEKRDVWTRLIQSNKLPAFAFLKNLRNIQEAKVERNIIAQAFNQCKSDMLLPIDFLKARQYAPDWSRELEDLMYRCLSKYVKLPGFSTLVVDVSGSMDVAISSKSEFTRMDAAASMAVLAAECCEHISIYATGGNDSRCIHTTKKIEPMRGFALADRILAAERELGGGGIFTRQVCDYLRNKEEIPDRLMIFSDSQDCDRVGSGQPKPHGKNNYIIDISSESHGVNYNGIWTAEISGWSEHFLKFVSTLEENICD